MQKYKQITDRDTGNGTKYLNLTIHSASEAISA